MRNLGWAPPWPVLSSTRVFEHALEKLFAASGGVLKKNLNASESSEHPPDRGKIDVLRQTVENLANIRYKRGYRILQWGTCNPAQSKCYFLQTVVQQ